MIAELKPCPFCGSDVELYKREFSYRTGYSIKCFKRDCFIAETTDVEWFSDKDYLIRIWNSRFDQPFVSDCVLNGNATQEMLDAIHGVNNG